ncbi:MAG: thiamine-phosphate kinase [Acidimicrobiales bacterium]
MTGEFEILARLAASLPPAPAGETWIGDDAAVLRVPEAQWLLLACDAVVAGVHADLRLSGLADLGWKAMVANLSDIAAMGGRPGHAVVSVAAPPGTDVELLYEGIIAAAGAYQCPVVGGDLANAAALVVSVAVTGTVVGEPVRRGGASPGDGIWLTGPLGAAAAGLHLARERGGGPSSGPDWSGIEQRLYQAHARPVPALAEGHAARRAGATAMIDVSDGFSADLAHLADASEVGFEVERVPVAQGATVAEALTGGEDYELVFCARDTSAVLETFSSAGLDPPELIGRCVADPTDRRFDDRPLSRGGWEHQW